MVFCPSLEIKNRNKIGCHVIRNALHEIKVDATSKQMMIKKELYIALFLTSSPPSRRLQPSDTDLYSIDSIGGGELRRSRVHSALYFHQDTEVCFHHNSILSNSSTASKFSILF
jgi:hypothetical protein